MDSGEVARPNFETLIKERLLVHVARSLLTGFAAMHERGIYHLDFKPSNLVLDNQGQVFIIDFGCAQESQDNWLTDGIGDSRYYAPERIATLRKKSNDGTFMATEEADGFAPSAVDAWALGLSLLQLALGRYPLPVGNLRDKLMSWESGTMEKQLSRIPELNAPAPDSLWGLIKGLLETNPTRRLSITRALAHPALADINHQFASEAELAQAMQMLKQGMQALPEHLVEMASTVKGKYHDENYGTVADDGANYGGVATAPPGVNYGGVAEADSASYGGVFPHHAGANYGGVAPAPAAAAPSGQAATANVSGNPNGFFHNNSPVPVATWQAARPDTDNGFNMR